MWNVYFLVDWFKLKGICFFYNNIVIIWSSFNKLLNDIFERKVDLSVFVVFIVVCDVFFWFFVLN